MTPCRSFLIATLAALAMAGSLTAPGKAMTGQGESVAVGQGKAHTYVELDQAGRPRVIGVALTASALRGLSPEPNPTGRCFDGNGNGKFDGEEECEGDFEFRLPLPKELSARPDNPFRWVGVNWNPHGHDPEAWSVPHFDFHFYIVPPEEIDAIRLGTCKYVIDCADKERARTPVPAKYVAEDHIDVEAAVGRMGNHLIDARTPEIPDKPDLFTHTWIYGANAGHIAFYEPMITLKFLNSLPEVCAPIRQPQAWRQAGFYPTKYCVRYHADRDAYTISLEELVLRQAE